MGTFHLTHPDGTEWEIDAPDAQSAADALHSQHPITWGDSAWDAAKSIGTGIVHGAAGFWPDLRQGGQTLENIYREKLGVPTKPVDPGGAEVNAQIDKDYGLHQPSTGLGKAFERGGEFIGNPASYVGGPESLAMKAGTAGLSGLGSYGGQKVGEQLGSGPIGSFVGAVGGGFTPTAAMKVVTPNAATASHLRDVAVMDREGIPLTAGDRSGNKTLRAAESELSPDVNEQQRRAFQQAAFNRVGENIGDRPVTGQGGAIDTMMQRVGQRFDRVAARNHVDADPQLIGDLQTVHNTYNSIPGLYPDETVNSVNGAVNRVLNAIQTSGSLSGQEYQTLRSNLRAAAQGASDPQRASALHGITNALDDTMERTIQRTNPADAGEWARARRDYRNALVLQKWGTSSELTPAALAQSAKQVYGPQAYVRGTDDFSELSEAAKRSISEYRSSETARRGMVENWTKPIAGLAGYIGGTHYGNPELGVLSGLAAEQAGQMIGRPIVRRSLMSNPVQGYLGNQLISREQQEAANAPISLRLARALTQTQGQ